MTNEPVAPRSLSLTRDEAVARGLRIREPDMQGVFIPALPSDQHVGVEAIKEGLRLAKLQGTIR